MRKVAYNNAPIPTPPSMGQGVPLPETEKMNLKGLTSVTFVMATLANKPLHIGGAYRF